MTATRVRSLPALLFWAVFGVLAFGFLAGRAVIRARDVVAVLDAREAEIAREVARAERARDEHAAILAAIATERAAQAELLKRMPCELGLDAFLPDLRARLQPLGITVRSDIGWKSKKDFTEEAGIPVALPEAGGAEGLLRAALQEMPRLVLVRPYGGDPSMRLLIVLSYRCAGAPPKLPEHRELIADRDAVSWPFDGDVRRREREIEALRARRDALAEPLRDALLLQRLQEDRERLARTLAGLEAAR